MESSLTLNKSALIAAIFGTLWITAVTVAWLVTGLIVNSGSYWVFVWAPAAFIAGVPFMIYSLASDSLNPIPYDYSRDVELDSL